MSVLSRLVIKFRLTTRPVPISLFFCQASVNLWTPFPFYSLPLRCFSHPFLFRFVSIHKAAFIMYTAGGGGGGRGAKGFSGKSHDQNKGDLPKFLTHWRGGY